MHRLCVINHGRYALFFHLLLNRRPVRAFRKLYGVLGKGGIKSVRNHGKKQSRVLQRFFIPFINLIYVIQFVIRKSLKLRQKNRRLDCIEPAVHSDADIVVFIVSGFAVNTYASQIRRPFIVVRKNSPAVSVTSERFCREKRSRGNVSEAAGHFSADVSAESLRTVLHKKKIIFPAYRNNTVIVCRKSEQVYRNNGSRSVFSFRDNPFNGFFQFVRIHVKRTTVHIHKYRSGAFIRRALAA